MTAVSSKLKIKTELIMKIGAYSETQPIVYIMAKHSLDFLWICTGFVLVSVSQAKGMALVLINYKGWKKGDFFFKGFDVSTFTPDSKLDFINHGIDRPCWIEVDSLTRIFNRQ